MLPASTERPVGFLWPHSAPRSRHRIHFTLLYILTIKIVRSCKVNQPFSMNFLETTQFWMESGSNYREGHSAQSLVAIKDNPRIRAAAGEALRGCQGSAAVGAVPASWEGIGFASGASAGLTGTHDCPLRLALVWFPEEASCSGPGPSPASSGSIHSSQII